MHHLVDSIRQPLLDFLDQRRDFCLILKGNQAGTAIAVNALRELEQDPGTDLLLTVSGDFVDADSWAQLVQQQFLAEMEILLEATADEPNRFPEIPVSILEGTGTADRRIIEIVEYSKQLVDPEGNHRVLLGFFPNKIRDPASFDSLLTQLTPGSGYQRWMTGVRLIVADPREPQPAPSLPATRILEYDLSHDAIQRALASDVENTALSDAQRVNALYQLAIFDQAFQRPDEALNKYDYLLGYFQASENEVMQAMVLRSIGEVHHREQRLDRARLSYEAATVPAMAANSRPCLQMILRSLAELERDAGNETRSQIFLAQMREASNLNGDVLSVLHAERQQAAGLIAENKSGQAAALLEQTAHRCRSLGLEYELSITLQMLLRVYRDQNQNSRHSATVQELKRLQLQEAEA